MLIGVDISERLIQSAWRTLDMLVTRTMFDVMNRIMTPRNL